MTGCNQQELSNLKNQVAQEKRRADAFQDDAQDAKDAVYAAESEAKKAVQESDKLLEKIQELNNKIEEIK